jgi:hypothetical protein
MGIVVKECSPGVNEVALKYEEIAKMVGDLNASYVFRNLKSHKNGDGMNKEPKHSKNSKGWTKKQRKQIKKCFGLQQRQSKPRHPISINTCRPKETHKSEMYIVS